MYIKKLKKNVKLYFNYLKILSFYTLTKSFIINSLFKRKIGLIRQKIERRLSMDIYKPINKHFFENLNCNINCDILPNFLKANFV